MLWGQAEQDLLSSFRHLKPITEFDAHLKPLSPGLCCLPHPKVQTAIDLWATPVAHQANRQPGPVLLMPMGSPVAQ